jgi:hypothetical protein
VPEQPERPKSAKEQRQERSAAALRANLRRRKEQQVGRTEVPRESPLAEDPADGDVTSS